MADGDDARQANATTGGGLPRGEGGPRMTTEHALAGASTAGPLRPGRPGAYCGRLVLEGEKKRAWNSLGGFR